MRVLSVSQGTKEWHAERARRFTASEAPAVMGASKYLTRSQLLHQKATGLIPEVTPQKQALFDKGHAVERPALAIVEEMIGEELFPATAVHDEDDRLLASFDGVNMLETVIAEHKLWSEPLAAQVSAGELEPHYYWQLEAQLLVSGAEKAIFVCSDGTRERFVSMEYRPVPGRAVQLLAAWDQFEKDLASYVAPATVDAAPVGRPPEALPALRIEVTGQVTASNLAEFKSVALGTIRGVNRELTTDQHFADAEHAIKWCADVEDRLKAAKQHALSQTATIDELFRTVDEISAEARRVRLDLDKLVKARKEAIRGEIVAGAVAALRKHITALNIRLGEAYMPAIPADFGAVIKGLRTVASVQDAVDTELARAKIAASEAADRVEANLKLLAGQPAHLFRDTATLVHKASDDLGAIIAARLAEDERRQAAERERIRREESERAEKAAREKVEAEARQAAQAATPAPAPAPAAIASPAVSSPAANVVPMGTRAPADSGARIRLGEINARLSPIALTADGLATLGFQPVATEKAAKLYRESDFGRICAALVKHLDAVRQPMAA